jgi:hypothetical protein
MKKYFRYLRYVLKHKIWVAYYCFKQKLFWRGIVHDLSKFFLSEFIPYANHFYGSKDGIKKGRDKTGYYKSTDTGDREFDFAWLLHQKRNDHHWQWWILPEDEGGFKTMPMSIPAIKEMVCDWRGAGRAQGYGDNTIEWYEKNKDKMIFHPKTKKYLEIILYTSQPNEEGE